MSAMGWKADASGGYELRMDSVIAIFVVIAFAASMFAFTRSGKVGLYGIEFAREDGPAEFWSFAVLRSCGVAGVIFGLTMILRN